MLEVKSAILTAREAIILAKKENVNIILCTKINNSIYLIYEERNVICLPPCKE